MLVLASAGCGPGAGPSKARTGTIQPKEPASQDQKVATNAGEATRLSPDARREKRWTVRWNSAQVTVSDSGNVSGTMEGVSGTLFRQNNPASDFAAAKGIAPREGDELTLEGRVRLTSRSPVAVLECDRIVWRPKLNRVEAKGNVRLEMTAWRLGVLPELWVTPDLKRAATPDLFAKGEHGRSD